MIRHLFRRTLREKSGHKPDYLLLTAGIALVIFGLIMLSSASSDIGKLKFNDTYYYLKHQLEFGFSLGALGFFLGYVISYRRYKKIAFPLLLLSIGALAAVFTTAGISAGGAMRWLKVGMLTVQPSEILKLTFVMYLAAWLGNAKANRQSNFMAGYVPFLVISGIVALLIFLQHSTSALVILMSAALCLYFVSGAQWSYILNTIFIGALLLAVGVYVTPYRFNRVIGYFAGQNDTQGSYYHLNQALIAIGSGGVAGVGYGQSTSKYNYLPESISDSIFAVIAEELGFVGATALILAFFVVALRGIMIAIKMRDNFGKLLMAGFVTVMSVQVFLHIAANVGLIPFTGVPLPFISYGGTSLAVFMTILGIMVNISKYA